MKKTKNPWILSIIISSISLMILSFVVFVGFLVAYIPQPFTFPISIIFLFIFMVIYVKNYILKDS